LVPGRAARARAQVPTPVGAPTRNGAVIETAAIDDRDRREIRLEMVIGVLFAAVMMGYACWAAFTGVGRFRAVRVGFGPDSAYYMRAAKAPVWSMKFLAEPQGAPFLFPLLAKLCLRNLRVIVLVQSGIATASWLFLAHTVARRLRRPAARVLGFTVLLLLAVSPPILLWNAFIATESLSISLLCIATALWIRLTGGHEGRRDFVWFVVVLAALACTRDSYAVVLLVVAVMAAIVALARRALRRRAVVVGVVCLVAALGNIAASNHAGRWFDPLDETIAVRLLGNHEATDYFVDHGMPLNRYVRNLHDPGAIVFLARKVTFGPEYRSYRHWLLQKGRGTYSSFLVTHPGYTISRAYEGRSSLLKPDLRNYGRTFYVEPRGAFLYLGKVGMPQSQPVIEIWIGLAAVAAVGLYRRGRDRALLLAMALSTVILVVHYLLAWHGDALEIDRHTISAAVELRIVLWVITAMTLDEVLAVVHSRRAAASVQV
jgi:hypothetical protein